MARKNIVELYSTSSTSKRVDIILNNFAGFERILSGYEKSLSATIKREREFNRRQRLGDIGIRVQTSGISDPTCNEVVNRLEIQEAIHRGDWRNALKDADDFFKHCNEIQTIELMRNDYDIVSGQLDSLNDDDYRLYVKYLNTNMTYIELADDFGLTHDAVRTRLYRSRATVKANSIFFMESDTDSDLINLQLSKCA